MSNSDYFSHKPADSTGTPGTGTGTGTGGGTGTGTGTGSRRLAKEYLPARSRSSSSDARNPYMYHYNPRDAAGAAGAVTGSGSGSNVGTPPGFHTTSPQSGYMSSRIGGPESLMQHHTGLTFDSMMQNPVLSMGPLSPGISPLTNLNAFGKNSTGVPKQPSSGNNTISFAPVPSPTSTSARSSRRASVVSNSSQGIHSLPKIATQIHQGQGQQVQQQSPNKKPYKIYNSQDGNPSITNTASKIRTSSIAMDSSTSTITTPTLVISPDMAAGSLPSNLGSTPSESTLKHSSGKHSAMATPGGTASNAVNMGSVGSLQDMATPGASTRSATIQNGSTASLRTFKKQYVLNEQLYLEKMRRNVPDDYYTRGIGPTSVTDEDEEFDIEMDEVFDQSGSNNKLSELDGNVDIQDDVDFGTKFINPDADRNENLVALSSRFLSRKLDWAFPSKKVREDQSSSTPTESRRSPADINDGNNNNINNNINNNTNDNNNTNSNRNNSNNNNNNNNNNNKDSNGTSDTAITTTSTTNNSADVTPRKSTPNNSVSDTPAPQENLSANEHFISQLLQDPAVVKRFEWQTMLANVLKGDIVKSEKTKIAKEVKGPGFTTQYSDDIWLELKAWMNGRNVDDQKKSLKLLRESADEVFQRVLDFRLPDGLTSDEGEVEIAKLMNKYYRVIKLWSNMKRLYQDKPIAKTEAFRNRIDTLDSWLNFKRNFEEKIHYIRNWVVGTKDPETQVVVDINDDDAIFRHYAHEFADQMIKEKDIEAIFQKRIFFPLAPWILKAKLFFLKNRDTLNELNLMYLNDQLEMLLMFPMRLVKDIIQLRLSYAKKLQKPTMMMIDQMIDDFNSYIRVAVQMKFTVISYCQGWQFTVNIDPQFDDTVVEAIRHLFILLELKLLDGGGKSTNAFKEPDILLKYWDGLKNCGHYIDGAGKVIAIEFTKLTLRLVHRLHSYLLQQQNSPPKLTNEAEAEKWLVQLFETLGSMKRKLNRFTNVLMKAFQNSVTYRIDDHAQLMNGLKDTGHFLVYTGGKLEKQGIYLIASPELLGCPENEILKVLYNSDSGCDLIPKLEIENSLTLYNAVAEKWDLSTSIVQGVGKDGLPRYYLQNGNVDAQFRPPNLNSGKSHVAEMYNDDRDPDADILELEMKLNSLGYILVLCPQEPMLWSGEVFNLSEFTTEEINDLDFKTRPDTIKLMCQSSSYALEYQCDRFLQSASDCVTFLEKRCSFEVVENNLQKLNKAYFRCTYSVLKNYHKIVKTFKKVCPNNDLLNGIFLFARDFGLNFLRINVASNEKKSLIILLLVRLSVGWLQFLSVDCDPTDPRTFRWCVTAMEFAMHMTSGWNILALDENQFSSLKHKISACMSLLISHFDVMGARAVELEKNSQQPRPNINIEDVFDDDSMLQKNSELRMQSIKALEENVTRGTHRIGKVLDDTDKGNKYISSLASSISNVSIRWQKRNFIGGGTFGSVYSAVDLDNGEILAVKEIRIQDSKAMEKVFPSIKEEMNVLEMLNHPNIVQYYGVEVHRDKVNIFMGYCEGGSMASLLEHGRIEDEMVTQVYTLELLEGLAYLHESGIVHRDIKPENILLDFNGIVKYVDFGAARKISKKGTKRTKMPGADNDMKEDKIVPDSTGLNDLIGTPMYMAPESITGSTNKGHLGSDDIWSLGCVVLEMITGRRPWANLDNEWAIMYHVAAGHIPQLPAQDEVSSAGRRFLKRCLVQDPKRRATAVELLMDPWIVEIREQLFSSDDVDTNSVSSSQERK